MKTTLEELEVEEMRRVDNQERMLLIFIVADSLCRRFAGAPDVEVSAEPAMDAVFFAKFAVTLTGAVRWEVMAKKHLSAVVVLALFPNAGIYLTLCLIPPGKQQ